MDFTEYIQEDKLDGFNEALNNHINSKINDWEEEQRPVIEKERDDFYKGKASQGADSILDNVSSVLADKYGFNPREKGQKFDEYFAPQVESYINRLAKEKNVVDSEFKSKYDNAMRSLADMDDYGDLKEKASLYEQEKEKNKLAFSQKAISKELPNFDKNLNSYEIDFKLKKFEEKILSQYDIKEEEGVVLAVSKDNVHLKKKLSELVSLDEGIQSLVEVTPRGISSGTKNISIPSVPFEVPETDDVSKITNAVQSYVNKKYVGDWRKKGEMFKQYFDTIMKSKS